MVVTQLLANKKYMKEALKLGLCLSFFCLLPIAALQAQWQPEGWGLKGGLNQSDVHESGQNGLSTLTPKAFFHIGVFTDIFLDLDWYLRTELLYSVKGGQTRLNVGLAPPVDQNSWHKAHYLTMPLLVSYRPNAFAFSGGLELGYLLADQFYSDGLLYEGTLYDHRFDLGLVGAVGYAFWLAHLELRYVFGLIPFTDSRSFTSSGQPGEAANYQNGVLQLSLGFRIF